MTYLLLGSGRMGKAITYDLIHNQNADKVIIGDKELSRAEALTKQFNSSKLQAVEVDVTDVNKVVGLMKEVDCAISAVVYQFNHYIAQAAIKAGIHYCDLGQNVEVVDQQFELDKIAKEKKLIFIPDGGLAPGMVNIIAAHGIKHFDTVDKVELRVGGLPQKPIPPLNYNITWSVHGLINEYIEKARILRNGKVIEIESLTELESLVFPPPLNEMEAFVTSGGTSTLPISYEGKIQEINYKTIRYPNHYEIMKALIGLGFTDETIVNVDGKEVNPRHLFEALLKARFAQVQVEDIVLLRVTIIGKKQGNQVKEVYEVVDYYNKEQDLTALMRTTGFSLAIVAGFITQGKIEQYGVLTQEGSIPGDLYIEELSKRGIKVDFKETIL